MKPVRDRDRECEQIGWCLVPPSIMTDDSLSATEKLLMGRLIGVVNVTGYCCLSNASLGREFQNSPTTISSLISRLQKKGLLRVELVRGEDKQIIQRRIHIKIGGGAPAQNEAE